MHCTLVLRKYWRLYARVNDKIVFDGEIVLVPDSVETADVPMYISRKLSIVIDCVIDDSISMTNVNHNTTNNITVKKRKFADSPTTQTKHSPTKRPRIVRK
jgi:hypothetical protein